MNTITYKNINGVNTVTKYGLACGYLQGVRTDKLNKQIFMEHNHYHVQSTVNSSPELHSKFNGPVSHKYTIWEVFSSNELTKARKLYNSIK